MNRLVFTEKDVHRLEQQAVTIRQDILNMITENAYHYEGFAEPTETGTFRVAGDMLWCTITGDSKEESHGFSLEEDKLTLTFSDATQIFYRKS